MFLSKAIIGTPINIPRNPKRPPPNTTPKITRRGLIDKELDTSRG